MLGKAWKGLSVALLLVGVAACGGDDGGGDSEAEDTGPPWTVEEVSAAFAEAGGVEFEEQTSLVDGAVALGPGEIDLDDPALQELNAALGDSSVLYQVFVFDGADPPLDEAAAEAVAFSSEAFEDQGDGIFLGDFDTAYYGRGNVVVSGPVTGGVDDPTLAAWIEVVDGL